MHLKIQEILDELSWVFASSTLAGEARLVETIISAGTVVCAGAGRVGLATAGFAKRLGHLGKEAFWIGDTTLPRTGTGDLMFISSGSGETRSIVTIGEVAKQNGLTIALLTCTDDSTLSRLADVQVTLNCPSKLNAEKEKMSKQPMTTLFEQACQIYLDSIVLELMAVTGRSEIEMMGRHNAIE